MKKLNPKLVVACAVMLYIIAVIVFHFTYDYAKYMCEEWEIILPATLIYFVVVAIFVFFIHSKRSGLKKELSEVSVDNLIKSIDETETKIAIDSVKDNDKFVGTGVIGLTQYITFCKIIGGLNLFFGVIFLLWDASEEKDTLVYGLYLIACGVGCLVSTVYHFL